MKGWIESGSHNPSGDGVWTCEAPLCGAHVRVREGDDRRAEHDLQFHTVKMVPGVGSDRYALVVDGNEVGEVWLDVKTYNLRRYIVSKTWVARLTHHTADGLPAKIGGHNLQRDTMQDVLKVLGEKAYGRGKNPKALTPARWLS